MKKQIKPKAGKGYRLLKVGEMIQEGDEIKHHGEPWRPTLLRLPVKAATIRRKLPPINFQRVAARMATELRAINVPDHLCIENALSIYAKAIKRGKK